MKRNVACMKSCSKYVWRENLYVKKENIINIYNIKSNENSEINEEDKYENNEISERNNERKYQYEEKQSIWKRRKYQ